MRTLVTGGRGFVGSHLAESMWRSHNEVAVTSRDASLPTPYSCYSHLQHALMDFRPNYIIHAACPADPSKYLFDPVGCIDCCVTMTQMILEYASQNSAEVLFISSGEVYGNQYLDRPNTENQFGILDPMDARACYAEGKRAGEALCLAYAYTRGTQVKVARLHHTYGPGMNLNDSRVMPTFFRRKLEGKPVQVASPGDYIRSYLYIDDAVAGLRKILLHGQAGQAYNVGSPIGISTVRLAEMFGDFELDTSRKQSGQSFIVPDTRKLRALGWIPQVELRDGIQRTLESYRNGVQETQEVVPDSVVGQTSSQEA